MLNVTLGPTMLPWGAPDTNRDRTDLEQDFVQFNAVGAYCKTRRKLMLHPSQPNHQFQERVESDDLLFCSLLRVEQTRFIKGGKSVYYLTTGVKKFRQFPFRCYINLGSLCIHVQIYCSFTSSSSSSKVLYFSVSSKLHKHENIRKQLTINK